MGSCLWCNLACFTCLQTRITLLYKVMGRVGCMSQQENTDTHLDYLETCLYPVLIQIATIPECHKMMVANNVVGLLAIKLTLHKENEDGTAQALRVRIIHTIGSCQLATELY